MYGKKWCLGVTICAIMVLTICIVLVAPAQDGDTVSIDPLTYDPKTGTTIVSGTSDADWVHFAIFKENKKVGPEGFAVVEDGHFNHRFDLSKVSSGNYVLKLWTKNSLSYEASGNIEVTELIRSIEPDQESLTLVRGTSSEITLSYQNCSGEIEAQSQEPSKVGVSIAGNKAIISGDAVASSVDVIFVLKNDHAISTKVTVTVKEREASATEYRFWIQMKEDADKVTTAGFTKSALEAGFWIYGSGSNASAALQDACSKNGIPVTLGSRPGFEGWIGSMFGLGDVKLSGGLWKYWAQYQGGNYNDSTLGHYNQGGSFEIIYMITGVTDSGDIIEVNPGSTDQSKGNNPETSSENNTVQQNGSITEIVSTEVTNDDGSKTVEQETTNSDGSSSSTSVTEKKNEDGSTTYDVEQTSTSSDGSSTVFTSQSTVKQGEDGSTITETTSSTESLDSEGNTTGSTEQISTSTETTDKDGNKQVVTDSVVISKDASGNATSSTESKTTETVKKDGSVEKIVEETTKDASGNVSSTKSVEEITKVSKNSVGEDQVETTKVETVKDASGNATSSTESKTTETVKKDGSVEKVVEETVKDVSGNVSSTKSVEETVKTSKAEGGVNKTEISTVETVKDAEGNQSSKVEVDKTVTEKVNNDGSAQKDTETNTKVTDASGNVTEVKEIVNATKDSSGLMNVKTTEITAADGSKTVEKVINAQTTDGSLRTTADVSGSESSDVTTVLKVESNDDGNIELSTDIIQKALEQQEKVSEAISDVSQDHNKVIEVKAESEDTIMSMSQESFKGISDSGSDFKMTSSRGSLTFSSDVLSNLSDMEDVSLSFTRADRSGMNEVQRNAVSQDSSIFDLKAMAGGESVGDRLGGNVDVAVKHTPAEGKTPVAYYLDDNGQKHRMDGQWFEKGVMHFITNHFSLYVIEDEVANPLPIDEGNDDSGSNTMLYAGVAIAIIAIIAIVAVVMVRRN